MSNWRVASRASSKRRTTGPIRASFPAARCGWRPRSRVVACCCAAEALYRSGDSVLRHQRKLALERRPLHVPPILRVVERRRAMLRATVVPEERIADAPLMSIDESLLRGEALEELDQLRGFVIGQPLDLVCPAADVQRSPSAFRMAARDRLPHVRSCLLLFLGQRRQMRVVDLMETRT